MCSNYSWCVPLKFTDMIMIFSQWSRFHFDRKKKSLINGIGNDFDVMSQCFSLTRCFFSLFSFFQNKIQYSCLYAFVFLGIDQKAWKSIQSCNSMVPHQTFSLLFGIRHKAHTAYSTNEHLWNWCKTNTVRDIAAEKTTYKCQSS